MSYYFVRVAGLTGHNNPNDASSFVENEPPAFPDKKYNYYEYCLKNNFVRIGWPDVGDLKKGGKSGALAQAYSLDTLKPHIQKYLLDFSHISLGDIILMPDKGTPGHLYIGEVVGPYEYYHDIPRAPYECAHRLAVNWDKDDSGGPRLYLASNLKIGIVGGWWLRAFHEIKASEMIKEIDCARN
jgi:hypothetical protein